MWFSVGGFGAMGQWPRVRDGHVRRDVVMDQLLHTVLMQVWPMDGMRLFRNLGGWASEQHVY